MGEEEKKKKVEKKMVQDLGVGFRKLDSLHILSLKNLSSHCDE